MTAFEERHSTELADVPVDSARPYRDAKSLELADQLLALLSTDDAYRARFEANPRAALRELGYETPAAHLGVFDLDPVTSFRQFEGGLASKAALLAARDQLRQTRDRGGDPAIFAPFDFCAG